MDIISEKRSQCFFYLQFLVKLRVLIGLCKKGDFWYYWQWVGGEGMKKRNQIISLVLAGILGVTSGMGGVEAVSYTHLDVYKRQL